MPSPADMRKAEMALFGTAFVFVGFFVLGTNQKNPSSCQWRTCADNEWSGDQATAFMLLISFSYAVLSWCSLAVLGQQQHPIGGDLASTISDMSLGFAAVAWIAAVDTIIGLGHFSSSRLQKAGDGWTCLAVIVAAYAALVCKIWMAATRSTSNQQVQPVVTRQMTVLLVESATNEHTFADPDSTYPSVSFTSGPPPADDVGGIPFRHQQAIDPGLDVVGELPLLDEYTIFQ